MSNLSRRISTIEKQLKVGDEQLEPSVLRLNLAESDEVTRALPENEEEWLTYQEQLRQNPNTPVIVLSGEDEMKAREQRKATKTTK